MLRYEDVIASQSADDLIPLVIEEFSMADARVVYENNTPHLVIEFPDCFSCKYRIDDSLRHVYARCAATYDAYAKRSTVLAEKRQLLFHVFAFTAMTAWLNSLAVRQAAILREIDNDTGFVSVSILLHGITATSAPVRNKFQISD